MSDRREEIISNLVSDDPYLYRPDVIKVMDEYFTERALELLEYMANSRIRCGVNGAAESMFYLPKSGYNSEELTKQELFENFL